MCLTRLVDAQYAYRARKNKNDSQFEGVSDLWYPPPDKVTCLGRVNRQGKSIFYMSASHEIATPEMQPRKGDIITMMRVKLKSSSHKPHVMELGIAETASEHHLAINMPILENADGGRTSLGDLENRKKNLAIRSFLAREFMRIVPPGCENQFKVTIAIAEILLESERIDGVLYPSIAGDGSRAGGGMNMAIKPDRADELFEPDTCWLVRVERVLPNHSYEMKCLQTADKITPEGTIVW